MARMRILPLLTLACIILLAVKGAGLLSNRDSIGDILIPPLEAQEQDNVSQEEERIDEFPEENEQPLVEDDNSGNFSETELQILKRLAQRRKILEQWEDDLRVKENVLNITQTKIDKKIVELRTLKGDVERVLQQYEDKEEQNTQSLVRIYESMKPKDAAAIFTELDINTLLKIVNNMKEKKAALIIAKMNPVLAKELTIRIAQSGAISTFKK